MTFGSEAEFRALRLWLGPFGYGLGLEALAWVSRITFRPRVWVLGCEAITRASLGFEPWALDLSLEAGI